MAAYHSLVTIDRWVVGTPAQGTSVVVSAKAFSHNVAMLLEWDGDPLDNDNMAMATMRAVIKTRQLSIRFGPDAGSEAIELLNRRLADQASFQIEVSTRNLSHAELNRPVFDPPSGPTGPDGPTLQVSVQVVSVLRSNDGGHVFSFKLAAGSSWQVRRYDKVVEAWWPY